MASKQALCGGVLCSGLQNNYRKVDMKKSNNYSVLKSIVSAK
jgi:hypothetical protein